MSILDQLQDHKKKLQKLAKEKPAFKNWLKQVDRMETIVIEADNMLKLKRDPTIQKLLTVVDEAIKDVDKQLSTDRNLTILERDLLFIQKDWNIFFIKLFAGKAKLLKSTEKQLKKTQKAMKKHGY